MLKNKLFHNSICPNDSVNHQVSAVYREPEKKSSLLNVKLETLCINDIKRPLICLCLNVLVTKKWT